MVEANDPWICQRLSAWQTDNLNCMTVDATTKQPKSLPADVSRHSLSANVGLNGYLFSGLPVEIGTRNKDETHARQLSSLHLQTSFPMTPNMYLNEQLLFSSRHDGRAMPREVSLPHQKKFFIFDRSGEETWMTLSSLGSPVIIPTARTAKPASAYEFPDDLPVYKSEQACPEAHDLYEESNEHLIIAEGSDYHEDTEEINALLYSDDDDINDDHCNSRDEDEVSTGCSPLAVDNGFEDTEQGEDYGEEVNSFVRPPKRHKSLASGSSSKLLSVPAEPMEKLRTHLYDDESVVEVNTDGEEPCPIAVTKWSRRNKIRHKLRILEKLLPGSQSKDPLMILEEAINYLKSLKVKANSLHVEDPESSNCHGSFL